MQVGEVVHYMPATIGGVVSLPYKQRRCMPAVVTRIWSDLAVNLVVFPDGTNDINLPKVPKPMPITWETSVLHGPAGQEEIVNAEWHTLDECAVSSLGLSVEAV